METPSGHPSSPTQISTNSKQPKTPLSESTQAAPQPVLITNIQHLHTETQILPLSTHLKLHASQLRQKAQLPTHPLHSLTKQNPSRRQMKQTIFENTSFTTNHDANPTNTTETTVQRNIREIHHSIVENHLQSLKLNKIINQPTPPINIDEQNLLR